MEVGHERWGHRRVYATSIQPAALEAPKINNFPNETKTQKIKKKEDPRTHDPPGIALLNVQLNQRDGHNLRTHPGPKHRLANPNKTLERYPEPIRQHQLISQPLL